MSNLSFFSSTKKVSDVIKVKHKVLRRIARGSLEEKGGCQLMDKDLEILSNKRDLDYGDVEISEHAGVMKQSKTSTQTDPVTMLEAEVGEDQPDRGL